jgi:tRNA1Val (adenine37-N6)-methyltransferase
MANAYFQFKQFTINQDRCAMKVTTDGCLFGAWVAAQLKKQPAKSLLDIGTGTGLLSLMIAQQCDAEIDAVEIDKDSFDQSAENITASPWVGRINAIHADARQFICPSVYDVIVSNPPFYENELRSANTKKNMAHHDESLLLQELLAIVHQNLCANGDFYLLLPYKRKEEIEELFEESALCISHITLVKQSVHHSPFRMLVKGTHARSNIVLTTGEIAIRNETNEYTDTFTTLLQAYYLHL